MARAPRRGPAAKGDRRAPAGRIRDYRGRIASARGSLIRNDPMRLAPLFFRWHRWLGYLVALQVLVWVAGGLVFAWLPFQGWVKGADLVSKPHQPLPPGWAGVVAMAQGTRGEVLSVQSVATAGGPALRLVRADGEQWLRAQGGELPPPEAADIERFARSLYKGGEVPLVAQRLAQAPRRLGLVRELAQRRDIWRASFDDALGTRLYFSGRGGELLAVRNEAWVWYDFFWRLHVMDYSEGEDFNNSLLRAASSAAIFLVLSGLVLLVLSLRRVWRRRGHRT